MLTESREYCGECLKSIWVQMPTDLYRDLEQAQKVIESDAKALLRKGYLRDDGDPRHDLSRIADSSRPSQDSRFWTSYPTNHQFHAPGNMQLADFLVAVTKGQLEKFLCHRTFPVNWDGTVNLGWGSTFTHMASDLAAVTSENLSSTMA